jgi:hypothetical protein
MEIILIIAVYILGCVLAYGRVRASIWLDDKCINNLPTLIKFTLASWIGFIAGFIVYHVEEEKTFFKFK